jgi:hypothetical protein
MYGDKSALNSFPCNKIYFVSHITAPDGKHLKSVKKEKCTCDHLNTYYHRCKIETHYNK